MVNRQSRMKCFTGSSLIVYTCKIGIMSMIVLFATCNMNTNLSTGCPATAAISPSTGQFSAGDVLTCDANGYPEPSYLWTDNSGAVVSSTSTVTLVEGPFSLTCTANGDLPEPCSASDSFSGIGTSKQKTTVYF